MAGKKLKRFLPWWMKKHLRKRAKIEFLRKRDGDRCWRCHHAMRFGPPYNVGKAATLEHIKPRALDGTSEIGNLALCHVGCNRHLGAHTPEQKQRMRLPSPTP